MSYATRLFVLDGTRSWIQRQRSQSLHRPLEQPVGRGDVSFGDTSLMTPKRCLAGVLAAFLLLVQPVMRGTVHVGR